MLNIKSIGYYTALGVTTGSLIGTCIGLGNVPLLCTVAGAQGMFLDRFMNGVSQSNMDAATKNFEECRTMLTLGGAVVGGLTGGTLGLIYGVAKEVLANGRAA